MSARARITGAAAAAMGAGLVLIGLAALPVLWLLSKAPKGRDDGL